MSPGEGAGNPRLLLCGPMSEGATATCRSLWDHLGQGVRIKSTVNRSACTTLVSCNFKPSIVQFLSIFRHQTIPSPPALLFFSTDSSSSREKSTTRAKLRFETTFQPSNRILIGIRVRYAAPNSAYRCIHRVHFRVSDTFAGLFPGRENSTSNRPREIPRVDNIKPVRIIFKYLAFFCTCTRTRSIVSLICLQRNNRSRSLRKRLIKWNFPFV